MNVKDKACLIFYCLWSAIVLLYNLTDLFWEVGASVDPAGVTMLDSIKIYGKTKEQFGWPEDPPEDFSSASVNNVCSPNLNQGNGSTDGDITTPTTANGTVLERYGICASPKRTVSNISDRFICISLLLCPFPCPTHALFLFAMFKHVTLREKWEYPGTTTGSCRK